MAVSCCVVLSAKLGLAGLMAIESSCGGVTVRLTAPETPLCVAVTVVVPVANPVARPPTAIVAAVGFDDVHVAEPVRFCVLPSE